MHVLALFCIMLVQWGIASLLHACNYSNAEYVKLAKGAIVIFNVYNTIGKNVYMPTNRLLNTK